MKLHFWWIVALLVAFSTACQKAQLEVKSGPMPLTFAPEGFPDIPFPAENPYTPEKWALGKQLFFDPVMSVDSSISCASCHNPLLAFSDRVALSLGAGGLTGRRNAPSLGNVAYHPYYTREGGLPTLEMQILVPIQEHDEFNFNIVEIAERLQTDTQYVAMSRQAFDREPDPYVITRALATFERTLISGNSPYDQGKLSPAEARGRSLFFSESTQCSSCHSGFNFTNYAFENNGLYMEYPDVGRFRFSKDSNDIARFKVPSLRNVGLTAPYMHDGSLESLEAVVDHYNSGGAAHPNKSSLIRPLGLSAEEKSDLVAFLNALTDLDFAYNKAFREDVTP